MRLASALICLLWLGQFAHAQNPVAHEAVNWDFEDNSLDGWRCKSNAVMSVGEDEDRGAVLEGKITYGEFDFGWFSRFIQDTDFSKAWSVELDVRGDGKGGKLDMQLGRKAPERPVYYRNLRDAVELDFTGWRRVSFRLTNFSGPAGRSRTEDLSQVFFLELFITGGRRTGTTEIAFDNIRVVPPTPEQAAILDQYAAEAGKLGGPPALDGSNLLPNSGFEMDLTGQGRPDFWSASDWGLGSVMTWETDNALAGERSVSVECASKDQRGSWDLPVPLAPGPWVFQGWYRTRDLQADPNKGVDARVTLVDADGRTIREFHAHGEPSETWKQTTVRFEAPAQTAAAHVYLFNFFAAGKVWWDDVHLGADTQRIAEIEEETRVNAEALEHARGIFESTTDGVIQLAQRAGDSDDWKLLLAALEWALDDAKLAIDAGLGTQALATLKDIEDYCRRADEILAQAAATPHAQSQAPDLDANPYVANLNQNAAGIAKDTTVYKKGEEGYNQIANAWTFRTLGEQCVVMAWGLLDPRSALRHDPALLKRLLTHYQAITQNHDGGDFNLRREAIYGRDENINRFCISPMMDSLLMLEAEYPWVILPSKREEWLRELRTLVDYQYRTYGPREPLDPVKPRYYPNMDVHHLLIMEWAWRLFGDEKYRDDRDTMLQWLSDALYPMGAWTYIWPQNECYVYHQLNVTFIARYYQVTGDERALEILRRSAGYYPLVHDAEGMTESYTDCSWKHYWSAAAPAGADVIAGMFDDGANKLAALDAAQRGYDKGLAAVYAAPWWRDIEPAPRRDNWLLYDEDIQGPRGQYGRFSFAGTARITPVGEIGKDTFVGCMISDRTNKLLPLDAALQVATVEARLKPDGNHWQNARYCSGREEPSVIVAPDFSTLCVKYRITRPAWGHGSSDEPWEGLQQWFLSENRLIGMLTIRAVEDTTCAGVWGRLRFGMNREFEVGEAGMFRYGSLIARIHDSSFASIETAPSETFFLDKPDKFRSREIIMKDAAAVSGDAPPFSYKAGQQFHFLAEVLPYQSDLADNVKTIREGPVFGFTFTEGARGVTVLHNESADDATYEAQIGEGQARVFAPRGDSAPLAAVNGRATVTIPAKSHVTVVLDR